MGALGIGYSPPAPPASPAPSSPHPQFPVPSPSYPLTWDSTTPTGQETFVPPKPQ